MTTTTLATRSVGTAIDAAHRVWNDEQRAAIIDFLIPEEARRDLKPEHLNAFALICERGGFDPFLGHAYLIPTRQGPRVHIGINGRRLIGQRSGRVRDSQIFWKRAGGEWEEVWLDEGNPDAALAVITTVDGGVVRQVAPWREFSRVFTTREGRKVGPWAEKPAHLLGIVAERHALMKACQHEMARAHAQIKDVPGVILSDDGDDPELPTAEAPRQIAAPVAPTPTPTPANGTSNGTASLTRDDLVKRWNEWTARAVLVGVEWEDLIPGFALEKVTEAELREEGPKLVKRVKAAEAKAAEAPTQLAEEDAPIEAELRESPAPAEPTDEPAAAVEFAEPPTLDAITAEFDAMSKEAMELNVPHRVPGARASAKDYADAILALEPKVDAARGRAGARK